MTRDSIQAAVIARTLRSDKVSLINDGINLALTEIQQVHDFRSTKIQADVTLNSGEQTVTLASDLFQLLSVRIVDPTDSILSSEIPLKDKTFVIGRYPNLSATVEGWPVVCFVEGLILTFVPPSTQAWTVRYEYFQLVPEIDNSGAVNRLLSNAVIAWVTAEVFRATQQYTDAQYWEGQYATRLKLAIRADSRTHEKLELKPFSQNEGSVESPLPDYLNPFAGSGDR